MLGMVLNKFGRYCNDIGDSEKSKISPMIKPKPKRRREQFDILEI